MIWLRKELSKVLKLMLRMCTFLMKLPKTQINNMKQKKGYRNMAKRIYKNKHFTCLKIMLLAPLRKRIVKNLNDL